MNFLINQIKFFFRLRFSFSITILTDFDIYIVRILSIYLSLFNPIIVVQMTISQVEFKFCTLQWIS